MKENVLSKSVKATMGAFEEKVKSLNEDKLASLKVHINKQVEIPLVYIQVEDNVRHNLDTNSIKFQELVESIRHQGLLQNLVVELRFDGRQHQLYCIAGQRRLLAAQKAGKTKATCLIKQFENKADRIASGLAENLTREDLHCLDIAEGYAGLIANGWTEAQIAQHFERNPRTIRRYLAIAAWPKNILQLLREHQDIFTTKVIFNEFVARRFASNEEFEHTVMSKLVKAKGKSKNTPKLPVLRQLEQTLKSHLEMKIQVQGNEKFGKVTISYNDQEQLQRLKNLLMAKNQMATAE